MRLLELSIDHLPGIRPGFSIGDLSRSVNVITGPNGSGKSSLLRSYRALLYRNHSARQNVVLAAVFEDARGRLTVRRVGDNISWQRNGRPVDPPDLPDETLLACYALNLEELTLEGPADQEITRRIARELSGGYDLRAVREKAFSVSARHGRNEAESLRQAGVALNRVVNANRELLGDESRLAALERELSEAGRLAADEGLLRDVAELVSLRQERSGRTAELEALPPGLDRLDAKIVARLEEADRAVEGVLARRQATDGKREDALRRLDDSGLASGSPGDGDLGEAEQWLSRLSDQVPVLRQLQADIGVAERRLGLVAAELAGAAEPFDGRERADGAIQADSSHLPPGDGPDRGRLEPRLDPATVARIESGLETRRALVAEVEALTRQLDTLPTPAGDEEAELERLKEGRRLLAGWLAAAGTPAWSAGRVTGALLVMAGLTAAALPGVAAGAALTPGLPVWSSVAVSAILVVIGISLLALRAGKRRAVKRSEFAGLGLADPEDWREEAVSRLLDELGRRLAATERRCFELRLRDGLEQSRDRSARELADETVRLERLAAEVGFDPLLLDGSFHRWAGLVSEYDSVRRELEEKRERRDRLAHDAELLAVRLTGFLARFGEEPGSHDPAILGIRLKRLTDRCGRRRQALMDLDAAEDAAQAEGRELARCEGNVRRILAEAGLDHLPPEEARHELRRRMPLLPAWQELDRRLVAIRGAEEQLLARLGGRDDLHALLAAGDSARIAAELARAASAAERQRQLSDEIARIRERVDRAQGERRLERARDDLRRCEDALRNRHREALQAAAGALLLEEVEEQYVSESRPATIRRAEEYFRRFTRHRFEFSFEDGRLGAVDAAADTFHTPEQLSTGTRAQLLLAVRVAFALEAEGGREPLPFFLDEALTTADPERFRAVVESLCVLAEEGRQVFYLTARPEDALLWQAARDDAKLIDVAAVRGASQSLPSTAELVVPAPAPIPRPDGMAPEEYAVTLGVSGIDLWSPAGAIHPFHVLRDDLELLHDLLELGVDSCGGMHSFLESGLARRQLSPGESSGLRMRLAGTSAWLEARRVGRDRPLSDAALLETGILTDRFRDDVLELNRDLRGDPRLLLERLRGKHVRGFRSDNIERLEEWLSENDYLDERETLDPGEVLRRVMEAVFRHSDGLGEDEVPALVRRLVACLDAGVQVAAAPEGAARRMPVPAATEGAAAFEEDRS